MSDPALELSIIIPAYNEEALLGNTLTAAKSALAECGITESSEVIVIDNNSTDATADIAKNFGASVVFEPVNQISRARNAGGHAARGRFLIFLDADTTLSAKLLGRALENLRTGTCSGGGVVIEMEHRMPAFVHAMVKTWNGIAANLGPAAGCSVYCLRDGFEEIGGFSEKVYAGEEIWFSRELKKWGKRKRLRFIVITDIPISTSSRKMVWYSPVQLSRGVAWVIFFPWLTRSKKFCRLWYDRPGQR